MLTGHCRAGRLRPPLMLQIIVNRGIGCCCAPLGSLGEGAVERSETEGGNVGQRQKTMQCGLCGKARSLSHGYFPPCQLPRRGSRVGWAVFFNRPTNSNFSPNVNLYLNSTLHTPHSKLTLHPLSKRIHIPPKWSRISYPSGVEYKQLAYDNACGRFFSAHWLAKANESENVELGKEPIHERRDFRRQRMYGPRI